MKAAFLASLGEFHGVLSHCDNEMTWPALLHSLAKTHLLDEGENEKILPPLPSFVKHTFNILFHRQ